MSKKMLKRSLALGALMAFVITGSAMSVAEAREYVEGKGNPITVTENKSDSSDRLVGGWNNPNTSKDSNATGKLNANVNVSGGNWDSIIGGHYASGYTEDIEVELDVVTTNTIIDGENTSAKAVVGGTGGVNYYKLKHSGAVVYNLTIKNGSFGIAGNDPDNCPGLFIVGGDLLKSSTYGDANKVGAVIQSSVQTVNTIIDGGVFNAAIIGGSAAIQYYTNDMFDVAANVDEANTTINGGTFNHAIVAGGFAYGDHMESKVTTANLIISGENEKLEINNNIYAGAMVGDWMANNQVTLDEVPSTTVATVENAIVEINNTKIKDIYGTGAVMGQPGNQNNPWVYIKNTDTDAIVNTTLSLTNVTAKTVDIPLGSVTLSTAGTGTTTVETLNIGPDVAVSMIADGTATDALDGDAEAFRNKITLEQVEGVDYTKVEGKMNAGEVVGDVTFKLDKDGKVDKDSIKEAVHEGNAGVTHNANIALMAWRAETNDMNKRMGELRNANGEHGVWARMVGGEDEFKNAEYEYTQYQLGYDEKLSVDPSWTVGVALSYTDGESNFGKGSGENTHKGLSVYGSKLNDDGSFIDLIAKYSRLEHDLTVDGDEGDYSTNGYSVSAEYGKRFQQGNGLWIEPQVELTYGKVKSAEYKLGQKTVSQDAMESLVGRVGFSLGKDISKGNVYARASYLYDFEGETNMAFTNGATREFAYDLGGGWWEVGVGANINLSKATYIYADVEKTFGGEVDTNWQWNLGVRYSF